MKGLAATYNGARDSYTFRCDDCDRFTEYCAASWKVIAGEPLTGQWSVTQRKQRCPECTEKARARGWVN